MSRRGRTLLLLGCVLLPALLLAVWSVWTSVNDLRQLDDRLSSDVALALASAETAVQASLKELPERGGTLRFQCDAEGVIQDLPSAARPPGASERRGASASPELLRDVRALERVGDWSSALSAVEKFLDDSSTKENHAAILTLRAALERRTDATDQAIATYEQIARDHGEARDERGLLRAHAARFMLLDLQRAAPTAWLQLYSDLLEDETSSEDHAIRVLKQSVLEKLRDSELTPADTLELERLRKKDAEHAASRMIVAAAERFQVWVREGAPGGVWATDPTSPSDPERLIVAVARESKQTRCAAAFLGQVAKETLVLPRTLGPSNTKLVLQLLRRSTDERPFERLLRGALNGYVLRASPDAVATARAEARRRALFGAGLSVLGFAVLLGGSILSLRAVRREMRAVSEREAFVAAVTHELKAPLASIRLLSEILERGGVEEAKVREFAGRTATEAERLSRLVTSVLELSRLERDGGSPSLHVRIRPRALAERVLKIFEPVAAKSGVVVSLRAAEDLPHLLGNEDALSGALLNLLDNALKYSDEKPDLELVVDAPASERIAFRVLDRGRGVPSDEAERIFEPFARIGEELTRDRPGVGLGLALVKRVVLAHRGSVHVEPRQGGGSIFVIELPAEPRA